MQKAEVNHASECPLPRVPQDIPSQDSSRGPHTCLPLPLAPSIPFPKGRKFYYHVTMPTLPSPRSELRAVRWAGVSGFSGIQSHQSPASGVGAESSVTSRPGLLGAEGQRGQPCRARRGPWPLQSLAASAGLRLQTAASEAPPFLAPCNYGPSPAHLQQGLWDDSTSWKAGRGALGRAVPKRATGHRMS